MTLTRSRRSSKSKHLKRTRVLSYHHRPCTARGPLLSQHQGSLCDIELEHAFHGKSASVLATGVGSGDSTNSKDDVEGGVSTGTAEGPRSVRVAGEVEGIEDGCATISVVDGDEEED